MLSEKFTTCSKCGKKPPEVTSFTIGNEVLCSLCASKTKWGTCERCGMPANPGKYIIEIGRANKEVEVCALCFCEFQDLAEKWFNQPGQEKAFREAEDQKAYLDCLARPGEGVPRSGRPESLSRLSGQARHGEVVPAAGEGD